MTDDQKAILVGAACGVVIAAGLVLCVAVSAIAASLAAIHRALLAIVSALNRRP